MKFFVLRLYAAFSFILGSLFFKKIGKMSRIAVNIGFGGFFQNVKIGNNFHMESHAILKSERRRGAEIKIGNDVYVGSFSIIKCYGGKIEIGNNVSINPFCFFNGGGGISIGDNVRIAAHTIIISSNHNFDSVDIPIYMQGSTMKGIKICDDVWIGGGVKILDGVTIGKGCVVGAGSIVTKNLDEYGIYVGSPARKIKSRLKDMN